MSGWTRSSPSPFPVHPGIQHHANPPTCTVESCTCLPAPRPCLPLCHARFPCVMLASPCVMPASLCVMPASRVSCPPPVCHARLPLCHTCLPCVIPASRVSCPPPICHSRESGNPESFPHPPRAGEGVGRGAGVIGPSLGFPLKNCGNDRVGRLRE